MYKSCPSGPRGELPRCTSIAGITAAPITIISSSSIMRFLITALALALSGANAVAVRPVTRGDLVLFDFDVLNDPHCEIPVNQTPLVNHQLTASEFQGFQGASGGSGCHFFGGGTAPSTAGAIFVNDLFPGCELDIYLDEECTTSPARPVKHQCVSNEQLFVAFGLNCTGQELELGVTVV